MLDDNDTQLSDRVTGLVTEILAKHGAGGSVGVEMELAKLGMTSIDMVELMLAVEADFDVTIPPSDITLENFRSIAAIRRMVERLCADAPQIAATSA